MGGDVDGSETRGEVRTNGVRTHYLRTGGAKPPMVLAHGATDSGECWASWIEAFRGEYDVIAYDARGHGRSEAPAGGYTTEERARDLLGLLDALELVAPILVGHSMGGQTVGWLAAEWPERPRALVLEDAGVRGGTARGLSPGAWSEWRELLRADAERPIDEILARLERSHPAWPIEDRAPWAEAKRRLSPRFVDVMGKSDSNADLETRYADIRCPTLFLKADAPEDVREIHRQKIAAIARGRIVHVEGAGHNVRRDRKDAAIAAVRAFLAEI